MSLFGQLFGAIQQQSQVSSNGDAQALTLEFTELAIELINDFVEFPNAVWVSVANDSVPDLSEPWKSETGLSTRHDVKIVFLQDTLEDRQLLRYLKKTETQTGNVNGIMYDYGFEPKLKDYVLWQGHKLLVNAVDPIAPIDKAIIYIIEFES